MKNCPEKADGVGENPPAPLTTAGMYSDSDRKYYERIKATCDKCTDYKTCGVTEHKGFTVSLVQSTLGVGIAFRACDPKIQHDKDNRLAWLMKAAMVPEKLRSKSIKGFVRGQNELAYKKAVELVHNHHCKGAVLYGNTGTGKTHLAVGVVNNRLLLNQSAMYVTVPQLVKTIGASYGNKTYDELMDTLCSIDLLLLDDLGTEKVSDSRIEELFLIINTRMIENRQIIATTNLSQSELVERYGARIVSRLHECCDFIEMTGDDWRMR